MKLGELEVIYIAPVNRSQRRSINHKKVLSTVSAMISLALIRLDAYASETTATVSLEDVKSKINEGGNYILEVGQTVGLWVAIIMAGFEIIKCIKDGDVNRVWGILTKYGMALMSLYLIEWLFKAIAGWFA